MTNLKMVRARFAYNEGLPFAEVLAEANILAVLNDHGVKYRDRVFNPATTIWGFLSQVLSDDHSCRDAVSRIIAHRATQGIEACSPNTASYCNARIRLPTDVLRTLTKRTAQELQTGVPDEWKWRGRSVFIVDGSLPDLAHMGALGHPDGLPQSGPVPGMPEWEYYFHGRGYCLTHTREIISDS